MDKEKLQDFKISPRTETLAPFLNVPLDQAEVCPPIQQAPIFIPSPSEIEIKTQHSD